MQQILKRSQLEGISSIKYLNKFNVKRIIITLTVKNVTYYTKINYQLKKLLIIVSIEFSDSICNNKKYKIMK